MSIAPGGSCQISVTFNPTAAGSLPTTITIASNDPITPAYTENITGTGVAPIVTLSPSPLDFGNQLINTTGGTITLTVSNGGAALVNLITSSLGFVRDERLRVRAARNGYLPLGRNGRSGRKLHH